MGVPPRPLITSAPAIPKPRFTTPTFDRGSMFLLLWGDSGVGKTTLAATAPGMKGYIQFDPGGCISLAYRDDFYLLDCSASSYTQTMMEFNGADPFGIKAYLVEHPDVETLVVDSITTLAFQALQYAVTKAGGNSNIDVPGIQGYGVRNNIMRRVVQSIMQIASGMNKNLIVIAHEGQPDEHSKQITLSLSAALANDISLRFNEVWWLKDTGSERQIHIRAHGNYKPMKSRVFLSNGDNFFVWDYDADTLEGEGIAAWMQQWQANGGRKIPLPVKGGKK